MPSFLTELLRNLPAIRTSYAFVVVLVAIGAWIWAVYLRQKPQAKTEEILKDFESDDARIKALRELVGPDRIPEKLERAEILEVLKLHYRHKALVLILVAVLATLTAIVAVIVVLRQKADETDRDKLVTMQPAPTGTITTPGDASTPPFRFPNVGTQTDSPPSARPLRELIASVHSAPGGEEAWPKGTLAALDALERRKSELTDPLRDQLRARAADGEAAIRNLLAGTGAPVEEDTALLEDLINVHQSIAALAGETNTWLETAQKIWDKRPVTAEKQQLPGGEPP